MLNYKRNSIGILGMIGLCVLSFCSCKKTFEDMNVPKTGSPNATPAQLYVAFISNLVLTGGDQNDDNGWLYPITQQGVEYTHPDFAYASTGIWSNYYHNLANYNAMMELISASKDSSIYTNLKAMMITLRAYQTIKVSDFYGDIPFSQAGKAIDYGSDNYKPAYDSQQSIYVACMNDLKWAVDNFNATDATQYSLGSYDYVLLNDITQWIKFANSLRLRLAVNVYDKDATDATPQIADALTKPLLSDYTTDNIGLYPANIPNIDLSPRGYTFGTECRLRMGSEMWEMMSSTNATDGSGIFDPRCKIFFEPNNAGQWNPYPQNPTTSTPAEGGDPYNETNRNADWSDKNGSNGSTNLYANFNYYWGVDRTIPDLFITAAETHFLKAEIYTRGMGGVTASLGTAATEYNAGIEASINFWTAAAINSPVWVENKPTGMPGTSDLSTYEANTLVAFDQSDATHAAKQIYAQEWIDMIRQPWDAWTLMKRTGGLTPMNTDNASYYTTTYGSYNRYIYPGSESTYNYDNWYAETKGNDAISTKIWLAK